MQSMKLNPGEYVVGDLQELLPEHIASKMLQNISIGGHDSCIDNFKNIPISILTAGETQLFFGKTMPFLYKVPIGTILKTYPTHYDPRGRLVLSKDNTATKDYDIIFSVKMQRNSTNSPYSMSLEAKPVAIIPIGLLLDQFGYENRKHLSNYAIRRFGRNFVSKNGISISRIMHDNLSRTP